MFPKLKGHYNNIEKQETLRPIFISYSFLFLVPALAVQREVRSNDIKVHGVSTLTPIMLFESIAHLLMYGGCFGTPA